MKKINYKILVAFLLVALFNSCDKKEDNNIALLGKWQIVKQLVNGEEEPLDLYCDTKTGYIEFFEDGTVQDVDYNEDCEEEKSVYEWSLSNSFLTIKLPFNSEIVFLVKILGDTLVLDWEKGIEEGKPYMLDIDDDGEEDDTTVYYKRIKQ